MKKIILSLSIFILAVISSSFGQVWSPSGAVWVYQKHMGFGGKTYDYISYIGDTTINSIASKVMEIKRLNVLLNPQNEIISTDEIILGHEYMYQVNNIVFWWRDFGAAVPLYQFNTLIGDKWEIHGDDLITAHPCYPNSISDSVEVIGKDVFDFGGVSVNRTFLKSINEHWGMGSIIEGIGTMDGPFPKPVYSQSCLFTDYEDGIGGYLVCYYDSLLGYVGGCNASFISSVEKEPSISSAVNLKIYPNPSTDILNIDITDSEDELKGAKLKIYNMLGQLVYSQLITQSKFSIPTTTLTTGIYILTVELNNKNVINQKIIKR